MLIADTDSGLCEAFGVIVNKSKDGKESQGVQRSTFLIDPHGAVQKIWRNVSVTGHAEEVLTSIS